MGDMIVHSRGGALVPVQSVEAMIATRNHFKEFISRVLVEGEDYGIIPGAPKRTLLQPGAQKIKGLFGLTHDFEELEKVQEWTGLTHNDEPFFLYRHKCLLYHNGEMVGSGIGSCNSWEKRYRTRSSERVCPQCEKSAIIKGRDEYGGGWLCFTKKGGCGAKFSDGDVLIECQSVGQVANPDIYDVVNTLEKMSCKRAMVAAVLNVTGASDYFTQDVEDVHLPGVAPPPAPEPAPRQQKPQSAATDFGGTKSAETPQAASPAVPQPSTKSYADDFVNAAKRLGMNWFGIPSDEARHQWARKLLNAVDEKDCPPPAKLQSHHWLNMYHALNNYLVAGAGDTGNYTPEAIIALYKTIYSAGEGPKSLYHITGYEWKTLAQLLRGRVEKARARGAFFATADKAGLWSIAGKTKDEIAEVAKDMRTWLGNTLNFPVASRRDLTAEQWRQATTTLESEFNTTLSHSAEPEGGD